MPAHTPRPPRPGVRLTCRALRGALDEQLAVEQRLAVERHRGGGALELLKLDVGEAFGAAGVTVVRDAHLGDGAAA